MLATKFSFFFVHKKVDFLGLVSHSVHAVTQTRLEGNLGSRMQIIGCEVGGVKRWSNTSFCFEGVKKQQSFESYLDSDGIKKQENEASDKNPPCQGWTSRRDFVNSVNFDPL